MNYKMQNKVQSYPEGTSHLRGIGWGWGACLSRFWLVVALLAVTSLAACSDDDDDTIVTAKFAETTYTLGTNVGDEVTLRVVATEPAARTTTIGYSVSAGDTECYAFSAPAFVIEKGQTEATLTLTRCLLTRSEGTLTITLESADDLLVLDSPRSTAVVFTAANQCNFTSTYETLGATRYYPVSIQTADGGSLLTADAVESPVVVDSTSTAVEGVHFDFPNGRVARFEAGAATGTVAVRFLSHEQGKDRLVLRLTAGDHFVPGTNSRLTISVTGQPNLAGLWHYEGLWQPNVTWWAESSWHADADALSLLIGGTTKDYISLTNTASGYQFGLVYDKNNPTALNNYFPTSTKAYFLYYRDETMRELSATDAPTWQMACFMFGQVNKGMTTSHNEEAGNVGFCFLDEAEQQLLVTIYDYEPVSTQVFAGTSWADILRQQRTTAYSESPMEALPIRLLFSRQATNDDSTDPYGWR